MGEAGEGLFEFGRADLGRVGDVAHETDGPGQGAGMRFRVEGPMRLQQVRVSKDGVERDDAVGQFVNDGGHCPLLQVVAHVRVRHHAGDARRLEDRRIPDAREFEQLGALEGARAENNFPFRRNRVHHPLMLHFHPARHEWCSALVLSHQHLARERARQDSQIRPSRVRKQVSVPRIASDRLARPIHGEERSVEPHMTPVAGLRRSPKARYVVQSGQERLFKGYLPRSHGRVYGAPDTVNPTLDRTVVAVAAFNVRPTHLQVLAPLEIRRQVRPRPAAHPEPLGPIVNVRRTGAPVGHVVDAARAAEHFPARQVVLFSVGPSL